MTDPDPGSPTLFATMEEERKARESTDDLESIDRWTECAADEAERLVRLLLEVLGEVGGLLDPAEHLHRPVPQKVNLKANIFFRISHVEL
jgi:hypothetical protein